VQAAKRFLDLVIAAADLLLVDVVQLEGLLEGEHVLGPIVPRERATNGLDRCLAADVAQAGKHGWVALAGDDGPQDIIPVTPIMSLTTWWSCTFICISAFCMC